MSSVDRWLLPDGVEEVLPPQAERLEALRRRVVDLYQRWGYEQVFPPVIEFLESLLTGAGDDLALQTLKVIDPLTGRLMGIRADITPQVARIDAHRLHREGASRLSYVGHVVHAKPKSLTDSRTLIQTGVELYGHAGIEADSEVINVMLAVLAEAGLPNVQLDLGHVDIYRALVACAKLNKAAQAELFDIYQRKAGSELSAFLSHNVADRQVADMLQVLLDLSGDSSVLTRARQALQNAPDNVRRALDDLETIADAVRSQHPEIPQYFDLSELRGYHYHTGVVFSAYVPGRGREIARGGRYDDIGKDFGRARPATGFSADLHELLRLGTLDVQLPPRIFAPQHADAELKRVIDELRRQGATVVSALAAADSAQSLNCARELKKVNGVWQAVAVQ